jgi:guanylate kinase
VTSRPKGEYETDGELFWFLSEEELVSSLDKDEFMEVTTLFLSSVDSQDHRVLCENYFTTVVSTG